MASGSRSMKENAFKRKRGELELLTDISNIPLNATSKRACTAKTGEKIENILKVKSIREGMHQLHHQSVHHQSVHHLDLVG